MKLHIVITASYHSYNVVIWLNPSALRWNSGSELWDDKSAFKFERRRDEFVSFHVHTNDPRDSKQLPKHGSMDALKAVLAVETVEYLEPVSYLKPRESLGEM